MLVCSRKCSHLPRICLARWIFDFALALWQVNISNIISFPSIFTPFFRSAQLLFYFCRFWDCGTALSTPYDLKLLCRSLVSPRSPRGFHIRPPRKTCPLVHTFSAAHHRKPRIFPHVPISYPWAPYLSNIFFNWASFLFPLHRPTNEEVLKNPFPDLLFWDFRLPPGATPRRRPHPPSIGSPDALPPLHRFGRCTVSTPFLLKLRPVRVQMGEGGGGEVGSLVTSARKADKWFQFLTMVLERKISLGSSPGFFFSYLFFLGPPWWGDVPPTPPGWVLAGPPLGS